MKKYILIVLALLGTGILPSLTFSFDQTVPRLPASTTQSQKVTNNGQVKAQKTADSGLAKHFSDRQGLEYFIKNSYSAYGEMNPEDFEDALYKIASSYKKFNEGTAGEIITSYARERNIPVKLARSYIEIIVRSVEFRENGTLSRKNNLCQQFKASPLFNMIKSVGMSEKTGGLLLSVVKNIKLPVRSCFIRLIASHPKMAYIFSHLYSYNREFQYLIPVFIQENSTTEITKYMLESHPNEPFRPNRLAVIEWKLNKLPPSTSGNYVFLVAAYIQYSIKGGLNEAARQAYLKLSPDQKKIFWSPITDSRKLSLENTKANKAYKAFSSIKVNFLSLASSLAAAFFEVNDIDNAKDLLKKHAGQYDDFEFVSLAQVRQFLQEAFAPKLPVNQIYDYFIDGYGEGTPRPEWNENGLRFGRSDGLGGWLFSIEEKSPVIRKLAAKYLMGQGYMQMSRFVQKPRYHKIDTVLPPLYRLYRNKLGPAFFSRVAVIRQETAAYRHETKTAFNSRIIKKNAGEIIINEKRPYYFREQKLPEKYWRNNESGPSSSVRTLKTLDLPVYPSQVVRLEKNRKTIVVLYTSTELDPTGEISSGGYWLLKSDDEGKTWHRPLYLGLQMFFPYVINPTSRLPLFDKNGLAIEVSINELDRATISFPPVGLKPIRQEKNLFISISWDDLARDQDQDGLTDIFEYRAGLNYLSKDSDKDGIPDNRDSLPLTPYKSADRSRNKLGILIAEKLLGYKKGALVIGMSSPSDDFMDITKVGLKKSEANLDRTIFLKGDPGLFDGIKLPFRLIVLGPEMVKRHQKQYGIFYPVGMSWIFTRADKKRRYIIWSATWRGGAFSIIKTKDSYKIIIYSDWIT